VVPGNLGKIDHLVILMLENRSFDHMLGYLKLQGKRPEMEGLTGTEVNHDSNGVAVAVHPLATDGRPVPTFFANDPGHGMPDVLEQIAPDPITHITNGGFVTNFAKQLATEAEDLPPQWTTQRDISQIASGDSAFLSFRPVLPGKVFVHTSLSGGGQGSVANGLRAQLLLRRPGQLKPVANVTYPFSQKPPFQFSLTHDVTDAELAIPGDWTCEVLNWTNTPITFATDASFMVALHDTRGQEPAAAIMGYYDAGQVPVFDFLASEYAVCDRWHASLPTDTWPNRLYALSGTSRGVDTTPSGPGVPLHPPGYTFTTIFEFLQANGVDWRIFFSDLPFPLVFKTIAQKAEYTARMSSLSGFVSAAQTGDLPAVSWLEPTFSDVESAIGQPQEANDDHPPGDITRGQQLVQQIYNAVSAGPGWSKTLLLITYDEHGGFFDHVAPAPPPPDDDEAHRMYGVRVPAFVISAWGPRRLVSKDVFDHTSLLATTLRRFCVAAVASMGLRTQHANDVGRLLSSATFRAAPKMPPIAFANPPAAAAPLPDAFGVVLRKTLFGF
jgi:phospholipase C